MGTRSASGFRFNGKDYLSYSQFDGYFESLGKGIVGHVPLGKPQWLE